ncbi:MAG: DUF2711 family protein [Bacteroidia bacterium]
MSDIFTDKNIYPHEGKIKDHFKDFYNTVFIAFLPFFQVDRQPDNETNLKKSKQITYVEAKEEIEDLKDIPPFNANIFSYSNKDYPTDEEVYKSGKIISWDTIVKGSGLANYSELNKALRTSIGALRQDFQRPELTEKLNNYTGIHNIWHPTEGGFDTISKISIYNAFKLLGKNQVIVIDEFYETTSTLELNNLTEIDFAEKVGYKDYFIFSSDKELLFTIEWDSFFFLIATDKDKMNKIISGKLFEGFLCDEKTEHNWDYEEGEIQKYLDIEEKQKLLTIEPTTEIKTGANSSLPKAGRSWWQKLFGSL